MIIRNDLKIIISYRKRQLIADVTYDRDQKLAENVEVKRQSLHGSVGQCNYDRAAIRKIVKGRNDENQPVQ